MPYGTFVGLLNLGGSFQWVGPPSHQSHDASDMHDAGRVAPATLRAEAEGDLGDVVERQLLLQTREFRSSRAYWWRPRPELIDLDAHRWRDHPVRNAGSSERVALR